MPTSDTLVNKKKFRNCHSFRRNRIQIREEVPKYLDGDVKLLTTQCVILEIEKLGHAVKRAMYIAKSFAIHRCGHNKNPVTGSACLLSMLGSTNPNRYIIATQDKELQMNVQNIPGAPLLYFNYNSAVMKPPSKISMQIAKCNIERTLGLSEYQEDVLTSLKRKIFGNKIEKDEEDCFIPKKKGPNPLSCKKKKVKAVEINELPVATNQHKRKRKKLKLPKHVKDELLSNKNS